VIEVTVPASEARRDVRIACFFLHQTWDAPAAPEIVPLKLWK
jgi:hypothetical protein